MALRLFSIFRFSMHGRKGFDVEQSPYCAGVPRDQTDIPSSARVADSGVIKWIMIPRRPSVAAERISWAATICRIRSTVDVECDFDRQHVNALCTRVDE